MSMERNVRPGDRQVQASAGKSTQRELPVIQEIEEESLQELPLRAVRGSTFNQVLAHALLHSGLDQNALARRIHISEGYMSRFLKGIAAAWAKRLVLYMRHCKSIGPLQWLAEEMGCDVVVRANVARELASAKARVAELESRYA
jgi:transcriptional regulator with XRE-family HTH domain